MDQIPQLSLCNVTDFWVMCIDQRGEVIKRCKLANVVLTSWSQKNKKSKISAIEYIIHFKRLSLFLKI